MIDKATGHLHREARFTDPAWTRHRHQAYILTQQEFSGGRHLFLAPHKAGPLHRKTRRGRPRLLNQLLREGIANGCKFPCCLSARDLALRLDHGNEAVSPSGDGLHESRSLGVVLQYLANLADGGVDAVVGVEEDVLAPNPFYDLVTGHELPSSFNQEEQQLHGNSFQLERPAGAAQFVGAHVQVEILAELDRI